MKNSSSATPSFDVQNSQSSPSRWRWIICTLLFAATTINYIDRQILSLWKPLRDAQCGMREIIGLRQTWGYLIAFGFNTLLCPRFEPLELSKKF